VPILDDEQFESYLKAFRPLPPESLQIEKRPNRARRPFVLTMWVAACATSLLLAILWWHGLKPAQPPSVPELVSPQSLTIGRANALLVHAPSLKEAFDDLSFQPQPASQPEGKQSALAVLSRDDIKENIKP
jgi:cytoskeletal protein RodZ